MHPMYVQMPTETYAEEAHAGEAPTEDAHAGGAPTEEAPAGEAPPEEAPTEELAEEAPTELQTVVHTTEQLAAVLQAAPKDALFYLLRWGNGCLGVT